MNRKINLLIFAFFIFILNLFNQKLCANSFEEIKKTDKSYDIKDFKDDSAIVTEEVSQKDIDGKKESETDLSSKQDLTPTTSVPAQEEKETKDIYLNFENTDLVNFVNYIADLKKINLIPDKGLEGVKVSLTIRNPLDVEQSWKVFLTILEMNGFSIIENGPVYKIIQKKDKITQPLPSYVNVPYQKLPDSDENIRYIIFFENIKVSSQLSDFVKSMLSPEASIIPYEDINGLIITDKSYNIKAAMKIVNEFDQLGMPEEIAVIRLKEIDASDVKTLLDSLIKDSNATDNPLAKLIRGATGEDRSVKYFSSSVKTAIDGRTNSLILLGDKKSIQKIEDFVTKYLDTQLKGIKSPLHVYELQNISAEQLKTILDTVVTNETNTDAAKYGAVRGGVKYFKNMKFEVDKDGNRLIAFSTDTQDWKLLKKIIKDLDKPQPQVGLEIMLVAVNFDKARELGGALRNKHINQIGQGVNFQSPTENGTIVEDDNTKSLLGNMMRGLVSDLGSSVLTFGKDTNLWGVVKALQTENNASVITQPFLTVTNNTKATLTLTDAVNVQMQESTGFSGYELQTAPTNVEITPQINLDGVIRLVMNVKFKEFTDPSSGDYVEKNLQTNVFVADGQVLVLGGWIQTEVKELEQKTPLLGDIPILNLLFKFKSRSVTKNYLFLFVSPMIIKPRTEPGVNLYTRMKLHQAIKNIDEGIQVKDGKDPIQNWFFNPEKEDYSHKVKDFANARYQPTTVDIKNDPYYHAVLGKKEKDEKELALQKAEEAAAEKTEVINVSTPDVKNKDELNKKELLLVDDKKRDTFKNLLTEKIDIKSKIKKEEVPVKKTKALDLDISTKKREEFKDFLTEKPNLALNQDEDQNLKTKKVKALKKRGKS